jgi:hypothetical protein
MYENWITGVIGRPDDRVRATAERDLMHRAAIAAAVGQARPSRVRALADRIARAVGRPATHPACCPA